MDAAKVDRQVLQKKPDELQGASYHHNLQQKAIFFFALTIVLTLIVVAALLYESNMYWQTGLSPLFLSASLLLLCNFIGGMVYFRRKIIVPLEHIDSAVQGMIEGQLDRPIPTKSGNEIDRVAERINDLAINMQEVSLYIWNHTQQNINFLDSLSEPANGQPEEEGVPSHVNNVIVQMRRENEELKDVLGAYSYFEVKLENEKMVSAPCRDAVSSSV